MAYQSNFGTGYLYAVPSGATPTPIVFAALQSVSVDFSFDFKALYGQGSFALEQARGKAKIDGKAEVGRLDPVLFNQLFFGLSSAAGETRSSIQEAASVPSSSPYTATVVNAATWALDLGVYSLSTGKFLTRVAASPSTGQYTVAAGVYSFAAADAGQNVQISYTYTVATPGQTILGVNPLMGAGPIFKVVLTNSFRGKTLTLTLNACQSSKLGLPFKLDDFLMPSLDFSAQDDGTGNVFQYSLTGTD